VTKEVFKDFCGAVFVIDKPEDAATLRSHFGGLTARVGMAAPPDKTPVPPVMPMSSASADVGTVAPPGPEPSLRGDAKEPLEHQADSVPVTAGALAGDADVLHANRLNRDKVADADNQIKGHLARASGVGPASDVELPKLGAEDVLESLPNRARKAYAQYVEAEGKYIGTNDGTPTDLECYKWQKEHAEDGGLPPFDSWQRYVREARRQLGKGKHTLRCGQPHGGSLVRPGDVNASELSQLAGGTLPLTDPEGHKAD
jgi:hypothetical protein